MEIVIMLRELWRRRLWVALSMVLAILVGLLMAYRVSPSGLQSRAYTVGVASTTAMLDTPTSQVVDLGDASDTNAPSGASLPGRAALIATVLTTSPLKEQIARTAGIDPKTLVAGAPAPDSALPVASIGSISLKSRDASLLTVTTFADLPIVSVNVTAPNADAAARLSNGAIKVLVSHLSTVANTDAVPANRRLVVRQLGAARVATSQRGPSRKLAAVAVIFIFLLLCAVILGISWVKTRWREADNWDTFSPVDWASLAAAAGGSSMLAEPKPEPAPRIVPAAPVDYHAYERAQPPKPPKSKGSWDAVA